jgi:anaerobic magnesium-protoporphyrin IX monomethyl ester cyclase
MKVLCLNPPFLTEHGKFSRSSRSPAVAKSGTTYFPMFLASAAGSLDMDGMEVLLLDSCARLLDNEATLAIVRDFAPDFTLLDTSTPSIYSDVAFGARIKEECGSAIALMGTHVTALPEESLRLDVATDFILQTEVDATVVELARLLERTGGKPSVEDLTEVAGISFLTGEDLVTTAKRPFIKDLDELPWLAKVYKKWFDSKDYFFAASDWPMIQLMQTRGCPHPCFFCVYPRTVHGDKVRFRTATSIVDEVEWVVENMPEVKEIGFEDDTFTAWAKRTREFCELMIARGLHLKIKWYCNTRATLDKETMVLMRRAGCVLLIVGYESGSQTALDGMLKGTTVAEMMEFSKNASRAKLLIHGCFMAGNRGDSRSTLKETLAVAKKFNNDTMQFFPLIVYPGTPAYEWAKENSLLRTEDYRQWLTAEGNHNVVLDMPDMDRSEILAWCDRARREYYIRPRYLIYKVMQQVRHPGEITRTFKAFWTFRKTLFKGSLSAQEKQQQRDERAPVRDPHEAIDV